MKQAPDQAFFRRFQLSAPGQGPLRHDRFPRHRRLPDLRPHYLFCNSRLVGDPVRELIPRRGVRERRGHVHGGFDEGDVVQGAHWLQLEDQQIDGCDDEGDRRIVQPESAAEIEPHLWALTVVALNDEQREQLQARASQLIEDINAMPPAFRRQIKKAIKG